MNQSKGTIYFRDNAWYKMENVINEHHSFINIQLISR